MLVAEDVPIAEVAADPATLSVDRLELQLKTHAAHIAAAMCRWLLLVAEYDRRSAYERWECISCAHWLAQHCQVEPGTAREYVRVARALVGLPAICEAFACGELSYSKVRALTRVATPDSEAELLGLAREMSASALGRAMQVLERTLRLRSDDDLARVEAERGAQRFVDDHGGITWVLHMSEDEDATFQMAIDHARDVDFAEAAASGDKVPARRGLGLPRLDAILAAVELGLAHSRDGDGVMPQRYLMVLNVEDGYGTDDRGRVTLANGVRLHPKVARRLGCDVGMQLVERCGDGTRMGRRVRTFTRNQRRLIAERYGSCGFPGCEVRAMRCQFHHIEHWTDGGPTDVDNGIPLCRRHHRSVHEGGWRLWVDSQGRVHAESPDGRKLSQMPEPVVVQATDGSGLSRLHEALDLDVRGESWHQYERANLRWIVDCILDNHDLGLLPLRDVRDPLLN